PHEGFARGVDCAVIALACISGINPSGIAMPDVDAGALDHHTAGIDDLKADPNGNTRAPLGDVRSLKFRIEIIGAFRDLGDDGADIGALEQGRRLASAGSRFLGESGAGHEDAATGSDGECAEGIAASKLWHGSSLGY